MSLSEQVDYATAFDYIIDKQVSEKRHDNTLPLKVHLVTQGTCLYFSANDVDVNKILNIFKRATKITYWHFGYNADCGRELICNYSDTFFTISIDTEKTRVRPESELLASV